MPEADTVDVVELPEATRRFVAAAASAGIRVQPTHFPEGAKTAAAAAAAIGCDVAAIVKSLVFVADDAPLLVLMSGDQRVSTAKLAAHAGTTTARRATLEAVRAATGFAAGGVPPLGHATSLAKMADVSLRRHPTVWAAAGTPTTVFPVDLDRLVEVCDAEWVDVADR